MDKFTIIIIAFVGMTYGAVLLAIQILAEKINSLHEKFDIKNKEDKDARR